MPLMDRLSLLTPIDMQHRLADLRLGRVQAIPGPKVFEMIRDKFDS